MSIIQICFQVYVKSSEIFILITPGPAWPFIIHWSVLGPAHKWQADVVSTPSRTPTHSGIWSLTGLPSGFRHVPTLIVVHDVILLPPLTHIIIHISFSTIIHKRVLLSLYPEIIYMSYHYKTRVLTPAKHQHRSPQRGIGWHENYIISSIKMILLFTSYHMIEILRSSSSLDPT